MHFWSFRNDGVSAEDGVLNIDGVLEVERDWWGPNGQVIARQVRQHLSHYKNVTVYINSPGGDVMAGAELYTALREHSTQGRGKVTVKITGNAASAASIVAMAGDEILISPVGYMMIHNPWCIASGNAKEMRHQADVLDEISEGLLNAYQLRTGKSRDELAAMLEAETYMSARTCVDQGFADGILWDDPQTKRTKEKDQLPAVTMHAKNYGRQAVMAMLQEHGAPIPDEAETAKRADIAKRAAILAAVFH